MPWFHSSNSGCWALSTGAFAQSPPQYGSPGVNLEQATKAVEAAVAEAKKNGWALAIAVVTNGGNLVHFSRMDQTQIGSIQIALHKAKAAAHALGPAAGALLAEPVDLLFQAVDALARAPTVLLQLRLAE